MLIMSRPRDDLKIHKLIEKLDGDRWRANACGRDFMGEIQSTRKNAF